MSKIAFLPKLPLNKANKRKLTKINSIIERYHALGYLMTVRQLYYQLVTQNVIKNDDKEYRKLSDLLTAGRLAGIVDWDKIADRIRQPNLPYYSTDVDDALRSAERHYRLDRQFEQHNYIELWVEKDALANIMERKTHYYHVTLMVNRGYSSTTAMKDAYDRILIVLASGRTANILYLGDHDPSGLDMAMRDIKWRLLRMLIAQPAGIALLFDSIMTADLMRALRHVAIELWDTMGVDADIKNDKWGLFKQGDNPYDGKFNALNFYIWTMLSVKHIALTTEQVREYNPPKNPAKMSDPRANWYVQIHGRTSWEVDALKPEILHQIIDDEILALIDKGKFDAMLAQEKIDRAELSKLPEDKVTISKIRELMKDFKPSDKSKNPKSGSIA
jgi:hypothetical protein